MYVQKGSVLGVKEMEYSDLLQSKIVPPHTHTNFSSYRCVHLHYQLPPPLCKHKHHFVQPESGSS